MRRITTTSLAIAVAAILFSVLSVFGQSSLPPMEAQAVYRAPVVVEVEVKLPNGETSVVSTTLVLQITSKTVISGDVLLTDSLSVDVTAAEGVAAEVGPIVRLFSDLVTSEVAAASAPLPAGAEGTVNRNANVRGGPGTNYQVVGQVSTGTVVTLVGTNDTQDWYQLEDGTWIAAFLVDGVTGEVPSAAVQEVDTPEATATQTPKPTATPLPTSTATAKPAPLPAFSSGGLGLSQSVWDEDHVVTDADSLGYIPSGIPYDSNWAVTFIEGNVYLIDHQYREPVSLADAEVESSALIPADSVFVRRYNPYGDIGLIADVYFSESLKGRFSPNWWTHSDPGTFDVVYNVIGDEVYGMMIFPDDNP